MLVKHSSVQFRFNDVNVTAFGHCINVEQPLLRYGVLMMKSFDQMFRAFSV